MAWPVPGPISRTRAVAAQRAELLEELEDAVRVPGPAGVVVVDAGVERGAPRAVQLEPVAPAVGLRRG